MEHSRHEKSNQDGSPLYQRDTNQSLTKNKIQIVNGNCISITHYLRYPITQAWEIEMPYNPFMNRLQDMGSIFRLAV